MPLARTFRSKLVIMERVRSWYEGIERDIHWPANLHLYAKSYLVKAVVGMIKSRFFVDALEIPRYLSMGPVQ